MLSLTMKGMPWSGLRILPASRSASRVAAICRRSGFSSSIALREGLVIYNRSSLRDKAGADGLAIVVAGSDGAKKEI